ncbi:PREDICTED: PHD and RING finger domain-containing protein 1-like isoform X2 [Branchiostoma belcheri]|uniref:PHD and RING finger domain-containing protein 1-like isoform X2 n=1 Tax=Branchiostoma belcheri TaxID=7741 RepID=A0A6P5AW98_BRABE|nr:PREDICTED: PHD and RING finger domain-containing protein 1-like isoform X2 [Branchiostoma belcheri]
MGDQDSSEEEFPSHGKRKAGRQNILTDDVSEGESDGAVDFEDDEDMEEDESGSESGEEEESDEDDDDDDSLDDEEDSGEEEEGSDSEEEEEEEDEQTEEDGQEVETVNGKANAPKDAVDEEEESCPICLNEFELQEVGTPAACQHNFCIDCILEWSKNINSCPVDRQQFNTILVRAKLGGKVIKKLKVSDVNQFADVEEEEEDNTYCQVCRQPTNEDRMLLCDSCDAGYHMECLTPPLDAVPIEEWFCPQCAPAESSREEEEAPQVTLLPVLPVRRAIARTMASERVRARVSRVRAARSRAQPSASRSVSRRGRGRGRSSSARGRSTSRSTSRGRGRGRGRRRGTTRRKTTRSRSTTTTRKRGTKKTTTTTGTTVKRRRRKKKRRKKTRKVKRVSVKKETPSTVKSRLAERLSLGKPIPGSSVPSVKKASDRKADFVQKPLMVFGDPDGLHCFEDGEETFPETAAVPVTSRYRRAHTLSKSALRSHRPVRRAVPIGIASELASSSPTHATSDATLDVLGSIFAEQEQLHLPSSDVRINRDGTLSYGRTDTNGTSGSHRGTVRVVPRGEHRPNRVTNGVPSNQTALGSPQESSTHPQSSAGTSSSGHNSQGSQQGGRGFSTSTVTSGSSTSNLGSSQGGQHPWGNQGAASLTTSCLGSKPNRSPSDDEEEEQPPKNKSESTDSINPRQDSKDESNSSTEESGSRLFSHKQWKPIQINIKSSLPHTETSPVQGSVRTDLPDGEEPQESVEKLNTSSHSSGAEQEYNPFSPTASPVHGEEGSGSVEYNPFSPTPEDEDDDQTNPSPDSETNNNDLAGTSKEPWEVEDSSDVAVDTGGLDLEQVGTNSPGVDSLHIDLDNLSPQLDREEDDDEPTLGEESREEEEMTGGEESIEDFQFEEELDEFPLQKSPETFATSPVTMEIPNTAAVETPDNTSAQQTESKKPASTSKASKAVLDMFSGLSPDKESSEGESVNQQEKPSEADSRGEALYEDVLVLDSGDVNLELHDVENAENEAGERQSQPVERRSESKDELAPTEAGRAETTTETDKNVSYFTSRVTHTERPTSQEGWDSSDEDTLDIRPLPNIMDLPKIPKIRQTVPTSREKEKTRDKSSSSKGKKRRRDSTAEGHQKERTKEKKRDREKRKEAGEQSRKRKSDAPDSSEDVSVSSSRRKRMKAKRSSSRRQSREREKRRDESFRADRSSSLEQEGEGRADRSHRSYRRHRQDSSSSLSLSSEEEASPERTRRSKSKDRSRMRSQHSSATSSKSKSKEDRERRKHHKESRREKNDSDKSDWSRGSSRDRKKEEKKRERKHEDSDRRSKERSSGKGREQRRSKEGSPQEYKKPKEKSPEYKREERLGEPPKSDSRTLAEKIAEKNEKLYNYGDHDYRKAKDDQKKEKTEKVKTGTLMEELRKVGKPRLQSTVRKVSNAEQDEDILPFSSFLSPGGMDRDHRSRVEREGPRTPEYSKQKNGDQSQPGSKDEDSDEGDSATLSRFLVPGGMDKDHRGADQLSNSNSSSRDDPRVEKMSRTSGERSNLPVLEPLRPPEIKPQLTLPQSLLTVLGVLTAQKPNAGLPSGPAPAGAGGGQHTVTIEATSPEDVEMRDVEESGRDDIDENIESSAVEMDIKEKMLEKLNRQERVAEEVKLALKPFYQAKKVDKQQYKEILKKSVIQVCHTKTGKIDPVKIRRLVRQYVEKYRAMEKYLAKKKGSSSSQSQPWYRQARK